MNASIELPREPAGSAATDYHGPREVAPGRWLYTCRNEGRLWPIGHCSAACAHQTAADAEAHYREYLLDSASFSGHWPGKEYRCEVCAAWTDRFVVLRCYVAYPLCHQHLNRAGLEQVLWRRPPGA
jgi:hypothetical protein